MSLLLTPLLVGLMSLGAAEAGCPTNVDWREYEGSCYWRSTYPSTWQGAASACPTVATGSQLASIHSLLENAFVMESYDYAGMWIGLNDVSAEGQFAWADGSTVDFENWQPGQPDDKDGNEDCVQVPHPNDPTAGRWDDDTCSVDKYFLCKMPATA